MKNCLNNLSVHLKNKDFLIPFLFSFVLLCLSLVVNYYAGIYATERTSNFVTDIILSNIPVFDVDLSFIYGPLVMWAFLALILILRPHTAPFTLKTVSLFVVIRSFFVILTHLGPFPTRAYIDPANIMSVFTAGNDLFFSGHTGLPFLLALIFWDSFRLRVIFFMTSVFFGIIVLLGHFHYTIDVFAAFFITYSIYRIALRAFPKDMVWFKKASPAEQARL